MTTPSTIAHYRISGKLGEGGMGAVYRATDTKLDREVAIKILPDAFAGDADRMARFTREAKLLASLNHPNIAAIYGVEDHALIMELVEGHDLRGPLPTATALNYARQIAAALDAAHEKGIVHRDLKPANIRITSDGLVKVLDFGLAKLAEPAGDAADPSNSPTMTSSHTRAGVIMGTAAYMSPEQARGHKVDKRADIWSFGVVLYEMLAGRKLFGGDTVSDTLAGVLKTDPDWSALPPDTPPAIRRLLRRCLERDRKQRLADIADARLEIDEAMGGPPGSPAIPQPRTALRWWNAALALLAIAGLAVSVQHFRETPPQQPAVVRFEIPAPDKASFGDMGRLALSPDGRQLAFIASGADGRPMLWVRPLDSVTAHALPGTEGAALLPFWSPDSRAIGFIVQGKIKSIEAAGGTPQTLCEVPGQVIGGSWSRDGVILFGTPSGGLFRVSQAGGPPARLTTSDDSHGEFGHLRPWFLPDGRHFLYFSRSIKPEVVGIYLASLDDNGKQHKRLVATDQGAAYAPPSAGTRNGHLLFLREGTLMALPLDARSFEPDGDPFPVAEHVGSRLAMGFFSVSANGVLAYRNGAAASGSQLMWFDRQGKALGTIGPPGNYGSGPTLSPDGTRAAVDKMDAAGNRNIWVLDIARGVDTRSTSDAVQDHGPAWSPDGARLVFSSARGAAGTDGIYLRDSSGTGKEEPLLQTGNLIYPGNWSPDGRYLLYSIAGQKTGSDLLLLPAAGTPPVPYLEGPHNEQQGQFSPDGRWIAYASDETGPFEIYVQSFPAGAAKFRVSTAGGSQPRWRRDGKELFFVSATARLMAVDVKTAPTFETTGTPRELFDPQIPAGALADGFFHYDVAADGKRFLVSSIDRASSVPSTPITVVLNWTALLKR